jgi:hypothetical protein
MRKLKAEWWELWWHKPGERPVFIRMYGEAVPHWIPDGCFPTRELALATKRAQGNRYIRVYRIRRYATSSTATGEKFAAKG